MVIATGVWRNLVSVRAFSVGRSTARRSYAAAAGARDPDRVVFFDTTLRDGEQSPGCTLNVEEKLTIAHQLSRLGVDVCEAGFPIASEGDFEAVRRIATEVGPITANRQNGVPMRICGLARSDEKDIKRCHDAVKHAPLHRIHTFLATSDIHLKHKLRISREQCIERAIRAVKFARSLCDDVEFSPEDAGRSDIQFLVQVLGEVIEAGATTLNIPDTVGYTTPDQYYRRIKHLIKNTRGAEKVTWSLHCHNDLGLATANALAGLMAGARQIECTVNGIGERAGNTALEEIAMILHTHHASLGYKDGINRNQIYRSSQLVTALTGMNVQPNKAIVGANAFSHESGVHQDGMLKNRETYEIMKPETVGLGKSSLVLGKHSGMNAFSSQLNELGYTDISPAQMRDLFNRFKALADKKKTITENDLRCLVNDEVNQPKEFWGITNLQISAGNKMTCTATLCLTKLNNGGEQVIDAATGNGPVDAIFQTINRITGVSTSLHEFEVKAVSSGSDAMGEVTVKLADCSLGEDSPRFHGHGADTDILYASAKAYLNAVNRILAIRVEGLPTVAIPAKREEKVSPI